MKNVVYTCWLWLLFVISNVPSPGASWYLEDTGWKAWADSRSTPTEYKPIAVVALSRTNIYVLAKFWQDLDNENAHWSQLNRWNGTTWTECTNSWIRGVATCLAYYNGELYVGGDFTGVGNAGNEIEAQNLGRYTISSSTWQAYSSGLRANRVNDIKVAPWYNGSSRTYLYVAGATSVGNYVSCNYIARGYDYGGWSWETMHGGVSGLTQGELDVTHVAINSGTYTHTVWVAGHFTTVGTSSLTATNIAAWIENGSGTSATWTPLGTGGKGYNIGVRDWAFCTIANHPFSCNTYGISSVGNNLYAVGNFNIINGLIYEPGGPCTFLYPIGLAKVSNSTTLGTWKNTGIDSLGGSYNSYMSSVAASGTNVYVTCGPGGGTIPIGTGGVTSSESLAKRYYEISGTGYFSNIPASGTGFTNISYDDVVAANQNCVFLTGFDSTGVESICRYEYR